MRTHLGPRLLVPVSERDHIRGPANAPVTLVEYGDYQCPYCGLANPIVDEIRRELGDRLMFVFRNFPLLTDFEPKGAVARKYGVYRQQDGICERALFVIDSKGVIAWSYVSPVGVNPGADGILAALEDLTLKPEDRK